MNRRYTEEIADQVRNDDSVKYALFSDLERFKLHLQANVHRRVVVL